MKSSVVAGLFTGIISILWLFGGFTIFSHLLNVPQATIRTLTGGLSLVILFIGIFYAMKKSRTEMVGKTFSYLEAFKSGFVVSILVALIVSLFSFIYVKYLNPGFADDMVKEAQASLQASGTSAADMAKKLAGVRSEFSLRSQITNPLIVQTTIGTIFSLILAIFLKTKRQS